MNRANSFYGLVLLGGLIIVANAWTYRRSRRLRREGDRSRPFSSCLPFVGALIASAGCLLVPQWWVKSLFWVPALLDMGTAPVLMQLYGERRASREKR